MFVWELLVAGWLGMTLGLDLEVGTVVASDDERTLVTNEHPTYRRFQRNFARRHDRGMLVRVEGGAAAVTPTEFENAGFTAAGQLAVGWLPWRRVGLHGTGWGWGTSSRGAVGVGPGITFWLQEEGSLFVSAAAGPVHAIATGERGSHLMIGAEIQLGLYGWVGDRWSMGASAFAGGESFEFGASEEVPDQSRARGGVRIGVIFN